LTKDLVTYTSTWATFSKLTPLFQLSYIVL